jgi:hypothetical protein
MRRKGRPYTVDFYSEDHQVPEVGHLIRDVSHKGLVRGYLRVLSVRLVKVRVSRGEVARYALRIERLSKQPQGESVSFTVTAYPPTPKSKPLADDPFSPLLPA